MNLIEKIQVELISNYTPLMVEVLEALQYQTEESMELNKLYDVLDAHDLPIDSTMLASALYDAQQDFIVLTELYNDTLTKLQDDN